MIRDGSRKEGGIVISTPNGTDKQLITRYVRCIHCDRRYAISAKATNEEIARFFDYCQTCDGLACGHPECVEENKIRHLDSYSRLMVKGGKMNPTRVIQRVTINV